jgi:hypothetical protein
MRSKRAPTHRYVGTERQGLFANLHDYNRLSKRWRETQRRASGGQHSFRLPHRNFKEQPQRDTIPSCDDRPFIVSLRNGLRKEDSKGFEDNYFVVYLPQKESVRVTPLDSPKHKHHRHSHRKRIWLRDTQLIAYASRPISSRNQKWRWGDMFHVVSDGSFFVSPPQIDPAIRLGGRTVYQSSCDNLTFVLTKKVPRKRPSVKKRSPAQVRGRWTYPRPFFRTVVMSSTYKVRLLAARPRPARPGRRCRTGAPAGAALLRWPSRP